MRFCFYCGEKKINSLYNDTVDRTEVEIQQMHARTMQGSIGLGAKVTFGKFLEFFGMPDLSASVDAKLQNELASHETVVLQLTPEQKQKIIEARALRDQGTLSLSKAIETVADGGSAQYVSDTLALKLDHDATPPDVVRRDKSAILSGRSGKITVSIRTALDCFHTEPTWLRFEKHEKTVGVFGLVTFVDLENNVADIEPLLLYYQ